MAKPTANEKRLAKLLIALWSEVENVGDVDADERRIALEWAQWLAKRGVLAVSKATVPDAELCSWLRGRARGAP